MKLMIEKIKEWLAKPREWYLRRKVIRGLKKSNRYSLEVEKLMESFATNRILSAASPDSKNQSRQVLIKHQQTIQIKSDFQDFLETL